jgi:DNA-binding CsgD family transcriptional regulator
VEHFSCITRLSDVYRGGVLGVLSGVGGLAREDFASNFNGSRPSLLPTGLLTSHRRPLSENVRAGCMQQQPPRAQEEKRATATGAPPTLLEDLTPRELEVVRLLAQGKTNPQIARSLVISRATAKVHVGHIIRKLGVSDCTQTTVRAKDRIRQDKSLRGLTHKPNPPHWVGRRTPLTQISSNHHNAAKPASYESRTAEFGFVSQNGLSAGADPFRQSARSREPARRFRCSNVSHKG